MMRKLIRTSALIAILWTFQGCDGYNKVLKSTDADYKMERAIQYFNEGDFYKSQMLLEELLNIFRGTEKGREVYYYYAKSHFGMEDYILGAYHLKNFATTFPNDVRAEETAYLSAFCYYKDSPSHSLDQASTYKAMEELQLFIDQHPRSTFTAECNKMMDDLQGKLEDKSFNVARLYLKTGNYKSAIIAFDNTLNEFPDTEYREEILYLQLQSHYLLAMNSVESKQKQRLKEALSAYKRFEEIYPQSGWMNDAKRWYEQAQEAYKKFTL